MACPATLRKMISLSGAHFSAAVQEDTYSTLFVSLPSEEPWKFWGARTSTQEDWRHLASRQVHQFFIKVSWFLWADEKVVSRLRWLCTGFTGTLREAAAEAVVSRLRWLCPTLGFRLVSPSGDSVGLSTPRRFISSCLSLAILNMVFLQTTDASFRKQRMLIMEYSHTRRRFGILDY